MPNFVIDPQQALAFVVKKGLSFSSHALALKSDDFEGLKIMLQYCHESVTIFLDAVSDQPTFCKSFLEAEELADLLRDLQNSIKDFKEIMIFETVIKIFLDIHDKMIKIVHGNEPKLSILISQSVVQAILNKVLIVALSFDFKVWDFLGSSSVKDRQELVVLTCSIYMHQSLEVDSFFSRKISSGTVLDRSEAVQHVINFWCLAGTFFEMFLTLVQHPKCPAIFLPNTVIMMVEMLLDSAPEISRLINAWFFRSTGHLRRYFLFNGI